MHLPTDAQSAAKTFIRKLLRQNDTAAYRKEEYFGSSSVKLSINWHVSPSVHQFQNIQTNRTQSTYGVTWM